MVIDIDSPGSLSRKSVYTSYNPETNSVSSSARGAALKRHRRRQKRCSWLKLSSLDLLGGGFQFDFETLTGRSQTTGGAIATFLMGIVTVTAFVIIIAQFFNTKYPTIINYSEFSKTLPSHNMYEAELISPIYLISGDNLVQKGEISQYVTVKGFLIEMDYSEGSDRQTPRIASTFDFVDCKSISDPKISIFLEKIIDEESVKNSVLCPNYGQLSNQAVIGGHNDSSKVTHLSIKVFPCSLDAGSCKPPNDLKNTKIGYYMVSCLVAPSNFTNPVVTKGISAYQTINLERTKRISSGVKTKQILDNRWHITPVSIRTTIPVLVSNGFDSWKRDSAQTRCQVTEMTPAAAETGSLASPCQELLEFSYKVKNEVFIVKRGYKKIGHVFGEFGGALKIFCMLLYLFSFYYSTEATAYLALRMFPLEMKNMDIVKKLFEKKLNKQLGFASIKTIVTLKEAAYATARSRINVVDLIKMLNFVELLQQALLEPCERVLLPVALLRAKHSAAQQAKINAKRAKMGKFGIRSKRLTEKEKRIRELEGDFWGERKFYGTAFHQAYMALFESEPENKIQEFVKNYMLENLKDIFDDEDEYLERRKRRWESHLGQKTTKFSISKKRLESISERESDGSSSDLEDSEDSKEFYSLDEEDSEVVDGNLAKSAIAKKGVILGKEGAPLEQGAKIRIGMGKAREDREQVD